MIDGGKYIQRMLYLAIVVNVHYIVAVSSAKAINRNFQAYYNKNLSNVKHNLKESSRGLDEKYEIDRDDNNALLGSLYIDGSDSEEITSKVAINPLNTVKSISNSVVGNSMSSKGADSPKYTDPSFHQESNYRYSSSYDFSSHVSHSHVSHSHASHSHNSLKTNQSQQCYTAWTCICDGNTGLGTLSSIKVEPEGQTTYTSHTSISDTTSYSQRKSEGRRPKSNSSRKVYEQYRGAKSVTTTSTKENLSSRSTKQRVSSQNSMSSVVTLPDERRSHQTKNIWVGVGLTATICTCYCDIPSVTPTVKPSPEPYVEGPGIPTKSPSSQGENLFSPTPSNSSLVQHTIIPTLGTRYPSTPFPSQSDTDETQLFNNPPFNDGNVAPIHEFLTPSLPPSLLSDISDNLMLPSPHPSSMSPSFSPSKDISIGKGLIYPSTLPTSYISAFPSVPPSTAHLPSPSPSLIENIKDVVNTPTANPSDYRTSYPTKSATKQPYPSFHISQSPSKCEMTNKMKENLSYSYSEDTLNCSWQCKQTPVVFDNSMQSLDKSMSFEYIASMKYYPSLSNKSKKPRSLGSIFHAFTQNRNLSGITHTHSHERRLSKSQDHTHGGIVSSSHRHEVVQHCHYVCNPDPCFSTNEGQSYSYESNLIDSKVSKSSLSISRSNKSQVMTASHKSTSSTKSKLESSKKNSSSVMSSPTNVNGDSATVPQVLPSSLTSYQGASSGGSIGSYFTIVLVFILSSTLILYCIT